MDQEKKKGFRTLLMSVLLSSPGPLVLGLGLMVGHSSTQIADFTRRTAELFALIVALVVYTVTNKRADISEVDKRSMERRGNVFSGFIMCVSGLSMLLVTALSNDTDKGNVIPALVIALLGAVTNVYFWRRYTSLYKKEGNSILGVQARLYGAKSSVDVCVSAALLAVMAMPNTPASYYIDKIGSVIVAIYMLYCGIRTVREHIKG